MGYSIYSISSSLASRLCLLCSLPPSSLLLVPSRFSSCFNSFFFLLFPIRFVPDPSPPSRPPSIGISCPLCARYLWANPLAVYRHRCSKHACRNGGIASTQKPSALQHAASACALRASCTCVRACVQKHTQAGEWEEKENNTKQWLRWVFCNASGTHRLAQPGLSSEAEGGLHPPGYRLGRAHWERGFGSLPVRRYGSGAVLIL